MSCARAIAVGLAVAALSFRGAGAQGLWTDQAIDGVPQFALTQSTLQVDGAGRPHLFVGGDRVYHYWLDGGVWRSEVVDPVPRSGEELRAAIGPNGEFHLAYVRNVNGIENPLDPGVGHSASTQEWYYATNLSGAWVVEELPALPPPAVFYGYAATTVTGIAADASRSVHLLARSSGGLFHAVRGSAGWTLERLDSDAAPGVPDGNTQTDFAASQELAIDGLGRVHALWRSGVSGHVMYSLRDGPGWQHQPLVSVGGTALAVCRFDDCEAMALVVDGGGSAHIVMDNAPVGGDYPTRLVHVSNAGGTWSLEDLGPGVRRQVTSIDPSGHLHVLTLESGAQSTFPVRHRWQTGSGWNDEVALSDASYTGRVSLAVDALGGVHAAAQPGPGLGDTPLWYLHRDSAWSAIEVARSGPVVFQGDFSRISDSATLGADVHLGLVGHARRLLYRDGDFVFGGSQVRHAVESDAGFQLETVLPSPSPNGPYSVRPNSLGLALAPSGAERAIWIGNGLSESVRSDDGTWSPAKLLDAMATVGTGSSRRTAAALDTEGDLHAVYRTGSWPSPSFLRHTADSPGGVVSEVISPVPDTLGLITPMSPAVAPGPLGSLHVAWVDDDLQRVMHATNASGAWVTSVVGTASFSGGIGTHSLLVESDGTVHLAYQERGYLNPRLMYGTNRCAPGWYVTEVDPLVVPSPQPYTLYWALGSRNPDITLDPVGNPHISYRRIADRSIGYAHVHQSVWQHETVVANTSSGEQTAIAVDDAGTVSIAHHDDWAGDLRLATRAPLEPEPRWDGCPPLPDPNAILDGRYVFDPPPDTALPYDPSESLDASYGAMTLHYAIETFLMTPWLYEHGSADSNGDSVIDAQVEGAGHVAQKRSGIQILHFLRVTSLNRGAPPNPNLRVYRVESIDRASRQRTLEEAVRGKLDGNKVTLDQVTQGEVPLSAFSMNLQLEITPQPKNKLAVSGAWVLRNGAAVELRGLGKWFPERSSADLHLKGVESRLDIRLGGVRIWRSRSDGIHVRADSLAARALGQNVKVDLTGDYEPTTPNRVAAPSGR